MTIIFNKRNGVIKNIFSGDLQTMDSLFGEEAQDYKQIWDEIVIPDDSFILMNPKSFRVNPESKIIELLEDLTNKYNVVK